MLICWKCGQRILSGFELDMGDFKIYLCDYCFVEERDES